MGKLAVGKSYPPLGLYQFSPHHHVLNFVTKAGFRSDASGLYIQGESLDEAPAPVRAIAVPLTPGASVEVPGLFVATYAVIGQEHIEVPAGQFDAWHVRIDDTANPEGAVWIVPGTGIVRVQHPSGRIDELVAVRAR